jgi:hypothetical protein
MFADVRIKPYEITLDDGKKITVQKERWLGTISRKDGIVTDTEHYFDGAVFDYDEETQTYSLGGEVTKTKAELDEVAESVCYFK